MTDTATQRPSRPTPRPRNAPSRNNRRAAQPRAFDRATIFGLAGAFVLIAVAIVLGGSWGAFVDIPALLIVLGGTSAVTTISFSLSDIRTTQSVVAQSLFKSSRDAGEAARNVITLAETARKSGTLILQEHLAGLRNEPYLARGLTLVIDGTPGAEAERLMRKELHAIADRHAKGASVLRRAADVAPAMGLIGTLVGLVQMLGNLEDPAAIGPAMAVALLTTFYGAVLGNMVLAPLAGKLERKSDDEALVNEVYLLGVSSIGRQESPRRLETLVNTILPPSKRVSLFD
ncbi:MAG: chemotaxis protein MotA [Alphaproteobacteria bacterium]|jgi:chemotaxis protein MotA